MYLSSNNFDLNLAYIDCIKFLYFNVTLTCYIVPSSFSPSSGIAIAYSVGFPFRRLTQVFPSSFDRSSAQFVQNNEA